MADITPQGPPVADTEDAFRAVIHEYHWKKDAKCFSTAIFGDSPFSVNLVSRSTLENTVQQFKSVVGVVRFNCGAARAHGFDTRDERDEKFPDNLAHAHVYFDESSGKRKTQCRKLLDVSEQVYLHPSLSNPTS